MSEDAFLELPSHRLHDRIDGDATDRSLPWILFCSSLGTNLNMRALPAEAFNGAALEFLID